jgi:hypothetical protein
MVSTQSATDIANAPARLGALLDLITSSVPGVTIVVAKLLPNENNVTNSNIQQFNANLPCVVSQRVAAGAKITLVDMASNWFSTADLGTDQTHPTEFGYLKMAKVFFDGYQCLQGGITPPSAVSGIDDTVGPSLNDPGATTAVNVVCPSLAGVPSAQVDQCSGNSCTTVTAPSGSCLTGNAGLISIQPTGAKCGLYGTMQPATTPDIIAAYTTSSTDPNAPLYLGSVVR